MAQRTATQPESVSFLGLLQIAFIVLKLVGTINWSWWWVLAPTWIPSALLILLLIIYTLFKK